MKEFYTRETANEGVRLPLYLPDGKASEHWLLVRGVDSDAFRKAETKAKRGLFDLSQIKDVQERADKVRDTELVCIASLIADWSFDNERSEVNVVNFLREAPQIADSVNKFAARRAEFYGKKPQPSTSGQDPKLDLKEPQKGQK